MSQLRCHNHQLGCKAVTLSYRGMQPFGNDDFLPTGKDNDDFSDFGPCNTQQETNMYGSDDCVLVFPDCVVPPLKHDSPYGVLVPLAKELAGIRDGNCTVEKLQQYKELLSNSIAKEKQELTNRHHQSGTMQLPAGNMVSSSLPSNKRHKTHGTKHMVVAIPLISFSMLRNWVSSISGSRWAWQQDTWYKAHGLRSMKSIFSSHKVFYKYVLVIHQPETYLKKSRRTRYVPAFLDQTIATSWAPGREQLVCSSSLGLLW